MTYSIVIIPKNVAKQIDIRLRLFSAPLIYVHYIPTWNKNLHIFAFRTKKLTLSVVFHLNCFFNIRVVSLWSNVNIMQFNLTKFFNVTFYLLFFFLAHLIQKGHGSCSNHFAAVSLLSALMVNISLFFIKLLG